MKRFLPFLILILLAADNVRGQETDSAAWVVNRYMQLLNYDALNHPDSMLYIESKVFNRDIPGDTLVMKRWFAYPNTDRIELWVKDKCTMGLLRDGKKNFYRLHPERKVWTAIDRSAYLDYQSSYDFHGPLYHWDMNGMELSYKGIVKINNQEAYSVFVRSPFGWDRYYLFEKESGLLFLVNVMETSLNPEDAFINKALKLDWRMTHEYIPLGQSLLPSAESYQNREGITIIKHTYSYLPIDRKLFDNPIQQKKKK